MLAGRPAAAHDPTLFYESHWGSGDLPSITYKFNQNYPSVPAGYRNRVLNADSEWDTVQGAVFFFQWQSGDSTLAFQSGCTTYEDLAYNGIVWYRDPGNFYGFVSLCVTGTTIDFFEFQVDNDQSWYTGTGSPSGTQVDLQHIVTHELGHATGGWTDASQNGHFNNDNMCPFDPPPPEWLPLVQQWQTMCDTQDALDPDGGSTEYGNTFRRSLETHDIHTFDDAY